MVAPEQSIKIKDLIVVVLRAWRQMIAFAVIGVILLAGFALYRGRTSEKSAEEVVLTDEEIAVVEAEALKENSDILLLKENIDKLNSRANNLKRKLTDGIYLKIDEKAQPLASFSIMITPEMPSEESEDTYEQRQYYLNLEFLKIAKGEKFANYLTTSYQDYVESQWIVELFSLSLDEERILHFEVTALDIESAERLAAEAETFFEEIIRESIDVGYLYHIEIQNRASLVVANPLIKTERDQVESGIDELLLKIDETQEEIDLIVEEALEEALQDKIAKNEEEQEAQPKSSLKRNVLKYGLAGAFIGILIAAFIAVFRATSSALVWSPEEFADQLKLLYIGSIAVASPQVKKKFGSGIDRWLEGIFYKKRGVDTKEGVRFVTSVIEGLRGKEGTDLDVERPYTVAVMGEAEDASMETLVEAIADLPLMQGVGVVADTAEGIKKLRSADAVVQLVQARRTSIRKAIHDLELAAGMGVQIHGIVGVESA